MRPGALSRRGLDRAAALSLLAVPYHLGHEVVGMGAGSAAIAPEAERLVLEEHPGHELGACFALNRMLAQRVREGDVVLAGNCHVAQGVLGAVGTGDPDGGMRAAARELLATLTSARAAPPNARR